MTWKGQSVLSPLLGDVIISTKGMQTAEEVEETARENFKFYSKNRLNEEIQYRKIGLWHSDKCLITSGMLLQWVFSLSSRQPHALCSEALPIWLCTPSFVYSQPTVPQRQKKQHQCCKCTKNTLSFSNFTNK